MSDQIGAETFFTDAFLRYVHDAIVTEKREGEFVMLGQTWRYVRRWLSDDGVDMGAALYRRIA